MDQRPVQCWGTTCSARMGDNAEGQRGGQRTGQAYPAAWTARDGTVGRQQTANMMFVAGKHAWKCSKRVVWMPWCKGAAGNSKQQQSSGVTAECSFDEVQNEELLERPTGGAGSERRRHSVHISCTQQTRCLMASDEALKGCVMLRGAA